MNGGARERFPDGRGNRVRASPFHSRRARLAARQTSMAKRVQHADLAMDLLRILLAILLPPLGVFLQVGLGLQFWLNILLTLLGYIPGIVHAIWIIARR